MKKLVAIGLVAALSFGSAPAMAQRHDQNHGRDMSRGKQVAHTQHYRVGHRFGPRYSYTSYSALPRTYVMRYHLSPRNRYVYNDGYIYVINPATFAVMRILSAF